jgi:hypothetical protein
VSDLIATARLLAWGLVLWTGVSVVAAAVVGVWFRSQARANDLLAVDERRRAFIEAASAAETIRS